MEHKWRFQNDSFFFGLKEEYTKHSWFLCFSDSRAVVQHYLEKDWLGRESLVPVSHNVENPYLIQRSKTLLSPFDIKLSLTKVFDKAMTPESKTQYFDAFV